MRSKFFDITGQKFGKLTAIKHISHGDWECLCECGRTKIVKSSNLRSHKPIKTCGGECRLPNRVGQKFNELLVLEEIGRDKHGRRVWKCLCSCGKKIKVADACLGRPNGQKSCGCLKLKVFIGKRFSRLVVLEKHSNRYKNKPPFWKCRCDCDNIVNVNASCLTSKGTKSCGCMRRDFQYDRIRINAFKCHKSAAKKRKYISELALEQYIAIASNPCIYCRRFSKRTNVDTGAEIELNSVDRRDNEPYYKLENSQSVCFDCQQMKMDMTDKEFRDQIDLIYNNNLYK